MDPADRAWSGGWRAAAWQVLGDLHDIGRNRIELASVELAEERLRLARRCVGAVITLFLLGLGLLLAVAWLMLWCEPAQRLALLGGLAVLCLGAAVIAAWRWYRLAADAPPLLQATLAEFARDRSAWADRAAP